MYNDESHSTLSPKQTTDIQLQGLPQPVEEYYEVSVSGSSAHGDTVTLTDTGNRFGTKNLAMPRHWEMGSEIFVMGQSVQAEPLGSTAAPSGAWNSYYASGTNPKERGHELTNDDRRHDRVDMHYRGYGMAAVLDPVYHDSTTYDEGLRLTLAYRLNVGDDISVRSGHKALNITGDWQIDERRRMNHPCDLLDPDGNVVKEGAHTVSWISPNDYVSYVCYDGNYRRSDVIGFTLRSQLTGATLELGEVYGGGTSTKHCRCFQGSTNAIHPSINITHTDGGSDINIRAYEEDGAYRTEYGGGVDKMPGRTHRGQWCLYEIIADFKNPHNGGWVEYRLNGERVYFVDNVVTIGGRHPTGGFSAANLGIDASGWDAGYENLGQGADWGEIYIDNDVRRIYLTDSPVFEDSTIIELQRPVSWSPGEVQFVAYRGELADDQQAYIHYVDGTVVEFEGLQAP